ncbi:MAG: geranylgeranylglyceryl/heptaprenylglyceryl phosphate synthase [Bacteroidales bacterium]|nr:geranylgeranylglyceryl/heptaprenylglyceryl phosphate synthase [Bacteroidales bacterium]
MNSVYQKIQKAASIGQKLLAVLIDPGKLSEFELEKKIHLCQDTKVDFIFLGGSLIYQSIIEVRQFIKSLVNIPVVLFPGNLMQMDFSADALLLLSMLSGRNPELLIGNHVLAAPLIRKSGIETISTAYLLIDGEVNTSVGYISNTMPIPRDKNEIAVATSIAAELLGFKLVYLEAGSGARKSVSVNMIEAVRANISMPIVVGGGIRSPEVLSKIYLAGADLVVVGTVFEENSSFLVDAQRIKQKISL